MKIDSSPLSRPIRIGARQALNRIVYQPMEANDADERGRPTDRTLARYRRFAQGGPGIICVEAMSISEESRGRVNELRINSENEPSLKKLAAAIREVNPEPLVLFQLSHDGRNTGSFGRRVGVCPTAEPGVEILSAAEIDAIGDQLARAAAIARAAGADGIDFKHCHGYLFCEMLRPANRRTDRYGGSFENRTRFFVETTEKIQGAVRDPTFILGCRVSAYEKLPGGFGTSGPESEAEDLAEPLAFARLAESLGMHYLNVSAGRPFTIPQKSDPEAALRVMRLGHEVKKAVGIPVIGSAYSLLGDGNNKLEGADPQAKSFRSRASRDVAEGRIDLAGVGRQSLADPLFAKKILSGEGEIDFCTLCGACGKLLAGQKQTGCAVYDEYYRGLLADRG